MYAPPPRKRKDSGKTVPRSGADESDGGGLLSDDYKSDVNNPSKLGSPRVASDRRCHRTPVTAVRTHAPRIAVVDSVDKDNLPAGVTDRDYKYFRRSQRDVKVVAVVGFIFSCLACLLFTLHCSDTGL